MKNVPLGYFTERIRALIVMKQNYKITLSYDGSRYYGWEHQPNTELTIQGKLEQVLTRMIYGEDYTVKDFASFPITVIGAGRTDAGVHARAMTANVILDLKNEMTEAEIRAYMNRYLPDDISINEVRTCGERFHSRFKATGKTYRYTCWYNEQKPVFERKYVTVLENKPDIEAMRKAAGYLLGEHDFKCFCGNSHFKKSTVRVIDHVEITENGPYIRFYFHGTGFLQNQVRIMTGTLLEIGFGKRTPDSMSDILNSKDRQKAGYTAEARGLCLMKVDYD